MHPIPAKTSISSGQETGILWVNRGLSTIPLQDKPHITHSSTAVCALLAELNRGQLKYAVFTGRLHII